MCFRFNPYVIMCEMMMKVGLLEKCLFPFIVDAEEERFPCVAQTIKH